MTDIVKQARDYARNLGGPPEDYLVWQLADEIDQLRAALELLKIAVDHEGWPAGWGQIRQQVNDALSDAQKAEKL